MVHQEDPTGTGLYKVMATYSFFASLILLDEVISVVTPLSLALQRSIIDLTTIPPLIYSTVQALEKLKLEPADSFKAKVEHLISQTAEEGAGIQLPELETASNPDIIINIRHGETERCEYQIRQNFVGKVITNVKEDFPHAGILVFWIHLVCLESHKHVWIMFQPSWTIMMWKGPWVLIDQSVRKNILNLHHLLKITQY